MAQNPIRTAAAATAGLVTGTLLETIVKRFGYVLNTGESLSGLDFNVGEPPLVVISADTAFTYFYDAADATTPDDGTTCLVSGNGLRYKASSGARPFMTSALTFASSAPGSPTVGDVHIVAIAATGTFAGHDNEVAFFTRRGWRFATSTVGLTLLVKSTNTNWQYNDAGWGAMPVQLASGSVPPSALQFPGGIIVESTLNAPPGSPTTGKFWIVGSSPTGAFGGHAADLAYWTGTAWAFLDPADGWAVYHKTSGFEVFYASGVWLGGSGSDFQEFSAAGSSTWTKPARGTRARVQVLGAGGSGGRAGSGDGGGGGGGGAYNEWEFKLSELAATETVTVGAGGAARTADNLDGVAGGNSSFGSWLIGYGGGGGAGNVSAGGGGGGGGGWTAAGATPAGGGAAVTAGGAGGDGGDIEAGGAGGSGAIGADGNIHSGAGGGGGQSAASAGFRGGRAMYGGGGGGGGAGSGGGNNQAGGNSYFGGAGGGGSQAGGGTHLGGTSVRGGAGGTGRDTTNAAGAGAQPGGGGGGSSTGNSGKGGDGLVRVTVY